MRSIHRWLMTVFVIVLIYWAVSGLVLQIYDMQDPAREWTENAGAAFGGDANAAALPQDETLLTQMMSTALNSAHRLAPGNTVSQIELRMENAATPEGLVTFGKPRQQFIVNTQTGEQAPPAAAGMGAPSKHNAIKTWHRGNIVGRWGVWVAAVVGLGLALLSLCGIVLYFDMLFRRKQVGRHGFFWS